jgi:hypothetical protein
MTFEEFFSKKKIDLIQLEKAEPVLYNEFKSHFSTMGEKSFDHTKKFWFNKLRRLYHLTPPEKAVTQVETAIASQAEPLSSPTIEQKPAFTPRFKSTNIAKPETPVENTASAPAPKPAFKPRNIPVKPAEPSSETSQPNSAESTPSVSKPAFKPRNISQKPAENKPLGSGETAEPSNNPAPKAPGFKPRNIKAVADENATDSNRADSRPGEPEVSETPITNPAKQEEATKEGYKPKFKLKNIPRKPATGEEQTGKLVKEEPVPESLPQIETGQPVESDIERNSPSSTDDKTPEQEIQENELDLRGNADDSTEDKPKPAYKPKFNLKNIKKSNPED